MIYLHQSMLLAVAFDARRLETAGTAEPILNDVDAITGTSPGDFDVSRTERSYTSAAQANRNGPSSGWIVPAQRNACIGTGIL